MQSKQSKRKSHRVHRLRTVDDVARRLNRFTMERFLATFEKVSKRRLWKLAVEFADEIEEGLRFASMRAAASARAALSESEKLYCELEGIDPEDFAARKGGAQ
ncbi:MAG TPA: hypothetical protein VFE51_22865 [Verrucomicrobiae bacterium]|nr:hypothetical protein [Verrucomicrobiae bacterium]